ncbi:hypothetical protein PQX77_021536, partial [Marasmius sp. AFHP31]
MSFTNLTDFIHEASRQYNTIGKALDKLRRLDAPNNTATVDPDLFTLAAERPSSDSWVALHILGALYCDLEHSRRRKQPLIPRQIKRHWPYLFPWIAFLLDAVITPGVTETQKGHEMVECILYIVPFIIRYPKYFPPSEQEIEIAELVDPTSPKLRDSVRLVWVMIVAQHHPLWQFWTETVELIYQFESLRSEPLPSAQDFEVFYSKWDLPSLSMAFVRHTSCEVPLIPRMKEGQFRDLLSLHTLRSSEIAMPGNPITMHPFPRFTVPTQARLISAILKRRQKVVFLPESERRGSFSTGLNNIVLLNLA